MTEIGEVNIRKRRSRQEIKRLVAEFETSGGIDLTRTRRKDWYRKTVPESEKV